MAFSAGAFSDHPSVALDTFNAVYATRGTKLDTCAVCHTSGRLLNSYGEDGRAQFSTMMAAGSATQQEQIDAFIETLKAIERSDSDGDGFSNLEEIRARTFPGDAEDIP